MIITIDGPVASGKSFLARSIAKQLKIYYLNSGLLYRALSYILIKNFNYDEKKLENPDLNDLQAILNSNKFKYFFDDSEHVIFNDVEITKFLKDSQVDKYSSIISANINVRASLLEYQRAFARENNLITDGRDTGSVVFPKADVKFFLTASIEIRAMRWQKDMERKGKNFSTEEAIKIITDRDQRDRTRDISPLIIPENAHIIDNTGLDQEETLRIALKVIKSVDPCMFKL